MRKGAFVVISSPTIRSRAVEPHTPARLQALHPAVRFQRAAESSGWPRDTAHPLVRIQQTAGNRAAVQLLQSARAHAKMKISEPEDSVERDADRTAETVLGSPSSQKEPHGSGWLTVVPDLDTPLPGLRGRGHSLPPSEQAFFESRFGVGLHQVRLHTDVMAAALAASVGALAFASGSHVIFGTGQYKATMSGRRLLTHELAHVIQQIGLPASGERDRIAPGPAASVTGVILRQRRPDISRDNIHTWYVAMADVDRVFAIQIGRQPDLNPDRVSIRFASQRSHMGNPGVAERTMVLTVAPSVPLSPRIVDESEMETGEGGATQKVINIQLTESEETSPIVNIILSYASRPADVPFTPSEVGGAPHWRPFRAERGWLAATDGFREITVTFPSIYPRESLWAEGVYPMVHPRLGFGYVHPDRGFVPYPAGRPLISAAERERLAMGALEVLRFGIHLLPVVGSLVMIGEALVGRSILGRRLSTTERVILGAGALLAEVGALIRAGRAVVAASRLSTVAGVSRVQALRMVMSARVLTDTERAILDRVSAEIRAGRALSEADQALANRIIAKMTEAIRVRAVRAEVEAVTGAARQARRFTDLSTAASADEVRVGRVLARELNADVIRPPQVTTRGVPNPDYVLDDVAAEALSPRTGNLERLLNNIVDKHRQAGVVVVDMTHTALPAEAVLQSAGRLWGRPNFADVSRIVIMSGERIVGQVLRPAASALAPAIIRGGASLGARAAGPPEPEQR